MDLDTTTTQAGFGDLVGISQQAVSELIARGVLRQGDTTRVWLLAYSENLRQVAAGRDPDGQLSAERARVARATADKIEMANAVTRRELAPVAVLELVLGDVARRLAVKLDAMPQTIKRAMPDLPAAAISRLAEELAVCREDLARVSIGDADRLASDAEEDEAGDAEAGG